MLNVSTVRQEVEASMCRSLNVSKPQCVEASMCRSLNVSKPLCVEASMCRSLYMSKPQCVEASMCRSLNVLKPLSVEVSICQRLSLSKPQCVKALYQFTVQCEHKETFKVTKFYFLNTKKISDVSRQLKCNSRVIVHNTDRRRIM